MAIIVGTDSYITVAEADTILADFFDTDNWDSADEPIKEKALKQATRNIDAQRLRFSKYDTEDQTLEFPRSSTFYAFGDKIGEVPDKVKTCEAIEALAILDQRASSSSAQADMEKGIVSRSTKSASVTYDADTMKAIRSKSDRPLSSKAKTYLNPWLQKTFSRV